MENNVKVFLGIFFLELETDSPFKNGKGIPEIATEKENVCFMERIWERNL